MQNELLIAHAVLGTFFILSVLIQEKGAGLSATFGGTGGFYATQRGAAKVMHYISIVLCTAFFVTALVFIVVPPEEVPAVPSPEVQPVSVETSDGSQPVTLEAQPVEENK